MSFQTSNRQEFIMLVGLPGTGKSTFINRIYRGHPDIVVASSDDELEAIAKEKELTYSTAFNRYIALATQLMNDKMQRAFSVGKSVVLDQTNLTVRTRKNKLLSVPQNYQKIAIYFTTNASKDFDKIQERLKTRGKLTGKIIPDQVFHDMHSRMEPPTKKEGFDAVYYVNLNGTVYSQEE